VSIYYILVIVQNMGWDGDIMSVIPDNLYRAVIARCAGYLVGQSLVLVQREEAGEPVVELDPIKGHLVRVIVRVARVPGEVSVNHHHLPNRDWLIIHHLGNRKWATSLIEMGKHITFEIQVTSATSKIYREVSRLAHTFVQASITLIKLRSYMNAHLTPARVRAWSSCLTWSDDATTTAGFKLLARRMCGSGREEPCTNPYP
jgi:hypothetical protein